MAFILMLASLVLAIASPSTNKVAGLQYLVGTWKCSYVSGSTKLVYAATYAYDGDGHTLREVAKWSGGGDEELLGYDPQHTAWSIVVFDDHGSATVMRGSGSDPNHLSYRSVYPDATIAIKHDRISDASYTLRATFGTGSKAINSVTTCGRSPH